MVEKIKNDNQQTEPKPEHAETRRADSEFNIATFDITAPPSFNKDVREIDISGLIATWNDYHEKNNVFCNSLYVHIPFCKQKCKYCKYYRFEAKDKQVMERYMADLLEEMRLVSKAIATKRFENIYIGGGTVNLLSPKQLSKLLFYIKENLVFKGGGNYTLELNPAFIIPGLVKVIAKSDVNRISIGVQTFNNAILQAHEREKISFSRLKSNIAKLREAKAKNPLTINLDIMTGLIGDSISNFRKTLTKTIELKPDTITFYAFDYRSAAKDYDPVLADKIFDLAMQQSFVIDEMLPSISVKRRNDSFWQKTIELTSAALRPALAYSSGSSEYQRTCCLGLGAGAYGYIGQEYFFKNKNTPENFSKPAFSLSYNSLEDRKRLFIISSLKNMCGIDI